MILGVGSVDHLDGLMKMRVKELSFGRNRTQAELPQGIVELLVDQLHAVAEFFFGGVAGIESPLKTVEDGQQCLQGIGQRELAEFLLFAEAALARVFELRLQAGQAVEQRIPFRSELL